jgi:hypothetical protein
MLCDFTGGIDETNSTPSQRFLLQRWRPSASFRTSWRRSSGSLKSSDDVFDLSQFRNLRIGLFGFFEERIKKHVRYNLQRSVCLGCFVQFCLDFFLPHTCCHLFVRSNPELERQAAKDLEETIAALEKTSVSTEAPASVPSVPEDPIGRLGRGFQTFKANHFE